MTMIRQSIFKTINRALAPASIVISPTDNMNADKKPFGRLWLYMIPEWQSSVLTEIKKTGLPCSFSQFQYLTANQFGSTQFPRTPVVTPGGSYVYFQLSEDTFILRIASDRYLEKQIRITLPSQASNEDPELTYNTRTSTLTLENTLILNVKLIPSPAYIFAPGMTLIRVLVRTEIGSDDKGRKIYSPVPGAMLYAVKAPDSNEVYVGRTDNNGQAVLCCNRMSRNRILQINGFDFQGTIDPHLQKIDLVAVDIVSGKRKQKTADIDEFWTSNLEMTFT